MRKELYRVKMLDDMGNVHSTFLCDRHCPTGPSERLFRRVRATDGECVDCRHESPMQEIACLGEMRYVLRKTGATSTRYGNCDICHASARDVCYQVECRAVEVDGVFVWSARDCRMLFGHKNCLRGARVESFDHIPED